MPDITPPPGWRFTRLDARSIEVHCPTFSTPLVVSLDVSDRHLLSFYNLAADLIGARAGAGNLPPLPTPKWIYHASDVPGEDDLYLFAESGDVGCEQCERLYTADQMRAYALAAAPAVSAPAAFDAAGFRAWVLANLPDETVIGSSAWWADHLTAWAGRFVKGAIQAPVTAAGEVSHG